MLNIQGSPKRLCNGLTRRDLLRVGGLGLAGLTLPDLLKLQESAASESAPRPRSFGRAKNVILLHLYGSPSQIEWVDPKPDAPVEIRGEFGSIESSLPGLRVCELLPNHAKVMDRCTVLRSMTHPYPLHTVAFALTGVPTTDVPMELSPRDARHWPFFGSVVDYLDAKKEKSGSPREVPGNITLPWRFSSRRTGEVPRAGPYAAFLGSEYDPVFTEFEGQATKGYKKLLRDETYEANDPYIGISPDGHFVVPSATSLQGDITLDRLDQRRSLISQLDQARTDLHRTSAGKSFDRYRQMTYNLLNSSALRTALDVRQEDAGTKALYGETLFGRACLAARRLTESGCRVATVFWDEYGLAGTGWDTHWDHFGRMKHELCPGLDQAWYGLITDLDQRGLLDETLVVCTSEHGRSPGINKAAGGGRDHWSRAYSTILAGGGVKRGHVIGRTDKHGGDVVSNPISPKDVLATMYHALGIDHHTWIQDALGRPLPLVDGKVITDALA